MPFVRSTPPRLAWLAWLFTAASSFLAAGAADAQTATAVAGSRGPAVVWLCGLSADLVQLVCVADTAPQLETSATQRVAPVHTAAVNGTRFPLDIGRTWRVDLWTPPTERARVEQLALATICYRSPGCEVLLTWPGEQHAGRRQQP